MDNSPASLNFAVIGHQESWDTVMQFIKSMRSQKDNSVSVEKVQEIFTYIPPGKIFGITINSENGSVVKGAYIETFIAPDELDLKHLRKNIDKVKKAGGTMALDKMDVPGVGWLAYCKDPEENIFGILQPH